MWPTLFLYTPDLRIALRIIERTRSGVASVAEAQFPNIIPPNFWIPNIFSCNVAGLSIQYNKFLKATCNTEKFSSIKKTIKHASGEHNDLVFLQETHHNSRYVLSNSFIPLGKTYPSKFYSSSDNIADGLLCFARTGIKILDGSVSLIPGRLDYIQFKHEDYSNTVHVYHVYNYTSANANLAASLLHRLELHLTLNENIQADLVYIVGDLNINLNSAPSLQLPRGYPLLRRILDNFHFVDVLLEAGEDGPTWRGGGSERAVHPD